jgi:ArsR family transcriptional regulator
MSRVSAVTSQVLGVPCADIMKSLADSTRLKIVELLLERPQNVQDLNSSLQVEATLLSHHLRVLKEVGLVECERRGRFVTYQLSPRLVSARRGQELDFGCCKLRFEEDR